MAAIENPLHPSSCLQEEENIENNQSIDDVHLQQDFSEDEYSQYSFFPIKHSILESFYQRQKAVVWTPQELDLSRDRSDWDALDEGTRKFIKFILFFFAQADGIVNENLITNFKQQTSFFKEATFFYSAQEYIETIHNETYSILIETFIRDREEKMRGYNAIKHYPSIKKIADWMFEWMDSGRSLTERVVAFACVEGIFFSSAFAAIYWIKRRNILQGLCKANEWIARDEALHTEFAVALYHELTNEASPRFSRLPEDVVHSIIKSAVDVSENFVREALQVDLIGMNADDMVNYVKCTADVLSMSFGYDPIYKVENKFSWMAVISLPNKSNFFESKVSEYAKQSEADFTFDLDADF
uniref:ribonucleoside-diphosphate reductase n=1 Tax=Marseillevirus LCMAC101 TaxID=2506602 RepID=A0A481YRZ5_9VIRU|nr:MAG: ribonucleoside diphosphate reductase, beta subunit [Marseillevirus LCMAC101]